MSPERLAELIGRFPPSADRGDGRFFLDKYLDVDPALAETSLETGKTAHQVVAVRHSPGAAGTVVCNLAALGPARSTPSASPATTASPTICGRTWPRWVLDDAPRLRPAADDAHLLEAARPDRSQSGGRTQSLRHEEPHAHQRRPPNGGSSPRWMPCCRKWMP